MVLATMLVELVLDLNQILFGVQIPLLIYFLVYLPFLYITALNILFLQQPHCLYFLAFNKHIYNFFLIQTWVLD